MKPIMKCFPALLLAASALAGPTHVFAQDWPSKSVRIMVGSAPGGGTDAMARAVADRLGPLLKQPVVVENRPGASNTLAADVTAKSNDGHTLLMGVSTAHAIAPHLLKLGYDNNKDLVPVVFVGAVPNVLVVNNALPVDSVQSLVKLAKSQPGKLNYATSGSGSTQHIAAELFKDQAGVFITHIPYRGSGPALVGLIGGEIDVMFENLPSALSHARGGKVRGIAVLSARRSPSAAEYPTTTELGMPDLVIASSTGLLAPGGTPREIVAILENTLRSIAADPESQRVFGAFGADMDFQDAAQYRAYIDDEIRRWTSVGRKANIVIK
ncbi:MAG: Bug family tripartite tricarboxylate transporter substrate binding protein [Burkholderiales bacterium]